MTATIPASTATSEPGTTGAYSFSATTSTSDSAPTSSVIPLVSPRFVTRSQVWRKKSPSPFGIPKSFGTWPMMIVSARPTMNPFSTGSEMKFARKPRRRSPATTASAPTTSPSVIVSCRNSSLPGAARSPTAAAESAAVAAIGPVTRCRELPNAA